MLIAQQKQKVVEKEAETERKKAVIGEYLEILFTRENICFMVPIMVTCFAVKFLNEQAWFCFVFFHYFSSTTTFQLTFIANCCKCMTVL